MSITEDELACIIAEIHEEMYLEVMTMPFYNDDGAILDPMWCHERACT